MIAFLQRIAGTHPSQRAADERFKKHLNGMAQKNKELEDLRVQIRSVTAAAQTAGEGARRSLPSNVSGEHYIELPEGVIIHEPGNEEGPERT